MNQNKYPSISVVIPAYNEEKNLSRLIPSLAKQTYPRQKIEYLLIDDGSTDKTRKLVQDFGMKIIPVKTHDIELNKGIGMHAAKNEYVYWLDCDMEICSNNFFELLVRPLLANKKIIGSFTREFALDCEPKPDNLLLRFISHDDLQRDPLYQFFSPSVESTVVKEGKDYKVCIFIPSKIPPVGRILYRRRQLLETEVGKIKPYIDLEATEIVARAGHQFFAFVTEAKIRHFHAQSLKELIHKRLRNMERDYLPNLEKKYYRWFDYRNRKDVVKITFWVIWTNLLLPELIRGIVKGIVNKDKAFLLQPIVSLATTDAIIYGFLTKSSGRKLARNMFINLLKKPLVIF